jgi:putative colanic acid biosynthesis UDP-glucose lipid carrier transferase
VSDSETFERLNAPGPQQAAVAESRAKRAFDLVIAATLLILLAPLMLLVAAAVPLESRGPALFRQRRTGLNGREFWILKFRSMHVQEDGRDLKQATRRDHRITRIGALIRALSIDELPQLINVLKGDMSLVGPRPHAVAHDELWRSSVPGYGRRFRARPGVTGYAQVRGYRGEICRHDDIHARIEADNHYIDHWSLGLDLLILLRTLPLLCNDPRAY